MAADERATVAGIVATRKLVSSHVIRHGGRVIDAAGDALLAAFTSASASADAAIAIQRALQRRNAWLPAHRQMELRIGLHLGEIIERDGALYGDAVNTAARLQALAEPGGVCLSAQLNEQLHGRLPAERRFDGEHRLKNIPHPVQVVHLVLPHARAAGAGDALDPALTLYGREADLATLNGYLARKRLVTLVGAGGVGKTRLADHVAARRATTLAGAVWCVDLAAVADSTQIAPAIARAARLQLHSQDLEGSLVQALAGRQGLLLLDSCEHLVASLAPLVERTLHAAPGLQVLATSQDALHVADEQVLRLEPLSVPPRGATAAEARRYGAIQLLEARVQAIDHRFSIGEHNAAQAIDVCRQLDGIALAIEMAAARVPTLGLGGLHERLEGCLSLLRIASRTAPERHQTMRATLDWSHSLLTADERAVLRRLSVFASAFELAEAQTVGRGTDLDEWSCLDAIASLAEKSLLQVQSAQQPRYRLLETTRLYAFEKLTESGEREAAWLAHGQAMAQLCVRLQEDDSHLSDDALHARYGFADEDIQRALDRSCDRLDADVLAATAVGFNRLGAGRCPHVLEQRRKAAAAACAQAASPRARAQLLSWLADNLSSGVPGHTRLSLAAEALAATRAVGEPTAICLSLLKLAFEYARADQWDAVDTLVAEATTLESPAWPARSRATIAAHRATVPMYRGDSAAFRDGMRIALQLYEQAGATRLAAWVRHCLADAALMAGDFDEAVQLERLAVQQLRALGEDRHLCWALANLVAAELGRGDIAAAGAEARAGLPHLQRMGRAADVYDALALLAVHRGDHEAAAELLGASDAWYAVEDSRRQVNETRLVDQAARATAVALGEARAQALRSKGAGLDAHEALQLAQRAAYDGS